jgi:hypothetical protein
MRAILTLTLTLLATEASAQVITPPPKNDVPYKGKLTVRVLPLDKVHPNCIAQGAAPSSWPYLACARVRLGTCLVILPEVGGKMTASVQAALRRHELAHCNWWPPNHPK